MRKRLIYIFLIIASLLFLFPVIWMLVTSLKTSTEAVTSLSFLPSEFRFSNYYTAWISSNFTAQFINSFIVASCVTVLQVVTSAMSGYALARIDFKGKNTLLMVLLATLIIPFQVLAVPVFAILKNIGAVNTYTGLILPSAANAFGIFLFKQFFEKIPRELEEAAFIDGVSRWNVLWKIIVPLSGPPMVTLAIFTFVAEWNDLFKPLILTSSSDMRTVQMGLGVFQEQFMTDYPLLMAAVTFVTIPGIVLFLMAQKRFIQGIAGTGIKG